MFARTYFFFLKYESKVEVLLFSLIFDTTSSECPAVAETSISILPTPEVEGWGSASGDVNCMSVVGNYKRKGKHENIIN